MPLSPHTRIRSRYPFCKIVSYHHAGRQFLTVTLNLGIDGMKIETHYPLSNNEELNFKLILGENSICSKGRVVRSESLPGKRTVSDVEFIELSEQNLATLQSHLTILEEWPRPQDMREGKGN